MLPTKLTISNFKDDKNNYKGTINSHKLLLLFLHIVFYNVTNVFLLLKKKEIKTLYKISKEVESTIVKYS